MIKLISKNKIAWVLFLTLLLPDQENPQYFLALISMYHDQLFTYNSTNDFKDRAV